MQPNGYIPPPDSNTKNTSSLPPWNMMTMPTMSGGLPPPPTTATTTNATTAAATTAAPTLYSTQPQESVPSRPMHVISGAPQVYGQGPPPRRPPPPMLQPPTMNFVPPQGPMFSQHPMQHHQSVSPYGGAYSTIAHGGMQYYGAPMYHTTQGGVAMPNINMHGPPPQAPLRLIQKTTAAKSELLANVTVYIGKIAESVADSFVRTLLDQCGPVTRWNRVSDPTTSKPKSFGFCQFASPTGALRAMRLLKDIEIDSQKLLVKVDKKAQAQLDTYVKDLEKSTVDSENVLTEGDDEKVIVIEKLLSDRLEQKKETQGPVVHPDRRASTQDRERRSTPKQPTKREIVARQQEARVAEAAERMFANDDGSMTEDVRSEVHQFLSRHAGFASAASSTKETGVDGDDATTSGENRDSKDYRRSRRRSRSRSRSGRRHSRDRHRRRHRSSSRDRSHDRDAKRHVAKAHLLTHEASTDSKEVTKEKTEADVQTKSKESPSLSSEGVRSTNVGVVKETNSQASVSSKPVQVSASSAASLAAAFNIENQTQGLFSKRNDHTRLGTKKTQEEINALIPTNQAELLTTPVDWDIVRKFLLVETKMAHWTALSVREYLGVDEPDLVAFILQLLEQRKTPIDIVEQMSAVLGDDAQSFVAKLWSELLREQLSV